MRRVELVGLVGLAGLAGLGWSGVAESWWVVWGEGVCVSVCVKTYYAYQLSRELPRSESEVSSHQKRAEGVGFCRNWQF